MSARHSTRPRRIEDALSQLVDNLTHRFSYAATEDELPDEEYEALAVRQQENLEHSWRILDAYSNSSNDPTSPNGGAGLGITRRGSLAGGENINNASDLIKRKLLRENASPDKAMRFSNLYSRLLTQPVLSQKWAILYLLYRLSSLDDYDESFEEEGGSRSPAVEPGNIQNLLWKGQRARQGLGPMSDEEGPAISSSASQIPARLERKASQRRPEREIRDMGEDEELEMAQEHQRYRAMSDAAARDIQMEEQRTAQPQLAPDDQQKLARPAENGLLRDLPFVLQGLSSSNLEFTSSTLKLPPTLPIPLVSLLNTLAEPGLLYKGLSAFVVSSSGGLLNQSLRAALSNELRSYLGLVATLEGEIRRALAAPGASTSPASVAKTGVTLKRCVVWTRDATMALRLMSVIVEEAQRRPTYIDDTWFLDFPWRSFRLRTS